jgi:hypothetical protein
LADATTKLDTGRQFLLAAMQLLSDPKTFYGQVGSSLKRAMNKIIFTKLYVDGEDITGHELGEAVRDVLEAQRTVYRWGDTPAPLSSSSNASSLAREDEAAWTRRTGADLLAMAILGHGSSKTALVGDTGIEPVTSSVSGKRSPTELIARGGCGNRTRVQGFAGPCLSHSANPP